MSNLIAQESIKLVPVKLDSIKIIGNETTEDYIILRELNFSPGDSVDEKVLSYNRERVFSLGIFNRVDFAWETKNNLHILLINVEESWYIYPLPYLKIRENSIAKSTYGMVLLYKNFRGRNETLSASATAGYDPFYSLEYSNPVLFTGSEFALGLSVAYRTRRNISLYAENYLGDIFDYKVFQSSISLGYLFNRSHFLAGFSSYQQYNLPGQIANISASGTNTDKVLGVGARYSYDSRNLKQFSSDGILSSVEFVHKGFGIQNIDYNVYKIDFREYRSISGNLASKWRTAYRHTSGGYIPFYDYSHLGNMEYVRGHRADRREGNNYIISSLEFTYPIVKEWNMSLNLPLLPNSLTSARIGLYLNAFGDAGTTYNNGKSIALNKFDKGWGMGITILILPYNAFRFEYSFDENMNGEFILGTGFSF